MKFDCQPLLHAAVARQLQEQQLQARQLVLQQQAASAVAAASKTQREVCTVTLSSLCCCLVVPLVQQMTLLCCCCRVMCCIAVQVFISLLHCLCRCLLAWPTAHAVLIRYVDMLVTCIFAKQACCGCWAPMHQRAGPAEPASTRINANEYAPLAYALLCCLLWASHHGACSC